MLCVLNLQKNLPTLAVSSINFFGTSLRAGNLSFCLLSSTSAISSVMATSSCYCQSPHLFPVLSKCLSLLLLSCYLYHQHFFFLPCNYPFQLSFFPVFFISNSVIQLFLRIVFAWSTRSLS